MLSSTAKAPLLVVLALLMSDGEFTGASAQPPELGNPLEAHWMAREIDEGILDAARKGSARDFANALARARIPAGVVLTADDMLDSRSPAGGRSERPVVRLGAALDVFRGRKPGRVFRELDGVILLLPTPLPGCAGFLTRTIPSIDADGPAFAVVQDVVRAANRDRSPVPPPSLVGSRVSSIDDPGSAGADDEMTYRARVAVHGRNVSTAEVLSDLVRQVPGLGWALVERYEFLPDKHGRAYVTSDARKLPCTVELFASDTLTFSTNVLR